MKELDNRARTLVAAADAEGVALRLVGGLAVRALCPSAIDGPLARTCKDIDVVGLSRQRSDIGRVCEAAGLAPDEDFNLYQGAARLSYGDPDSGLTVDVFLDRLSMCHVLELEDRLALAPRTLDPADLLLSKLQVVETDERDLQDAVALLSDTQIDVVYIAELLARDWGWWRTATEVLGRVVAYAHTVPDRAISARAVDQARRLREAVDSAPKSRKWKLRARIGDRVTWYQVPEEVEP